MLEAGIHHPRKHEQKEIGEKTYHRDFPKRFMKEHETSP